jgi:hypothetical protein
MDPQHCQGMVVFDNKKTLVLQTVAELGMVVFNALDFGLKEEEERQLSPALEHLIDTMTAAGNFLKGQSHQCWV